MGNRDWETKSARPCASRIYVQNSISLAARMLVRMAADHHVKCGGFRVQIESLAIVQYVNVDASRFGYGGLWKRFGPVPGIDVSAHRYHWSNV